MRRMQNLKFLTNVIAKIPNIFFLLNNLAIDKNKSVVNQLKYLEIDVLSKFNSRVSRIFSIAGRLIKLHIEF